MSDVGVAPAAAIAAPHLGALRRVLFVAATLWGASLFWITDHLPMVDLPQHAGQVALLRDLLLGDSTWAELVRTNWLTPYLLAYSLAVPLSLVMPAGAALQLLLTVAYLAFVALCLRIGRHFGSDPRLAPLYLVGFFGLAWTWGFVTFLVTAPLVLAFVLVASRHASAPTRRGGVLVFAFGMLMLASHGLAFLFGWGVGAAMLALEWRHQPRRLLRAALPYVARGRAVVGYFLVSRLVQSEFKVVYDYWANLDYRWTRVLKVPLYAIGSKEDRYLLPFALALFALPLLMGLRMRRHHWRSTVPLGVVVLIMFAVPAFAFDTAFLYERFGVFLLPAWAWAFPAAAPAAPARWRAPLVLVLALLVAFVLGQHTLRIWRFGEETRGIDATLRGLPPGGRILNLPFTRGSESTGYPFAYMHYAAWYQADSRGFVDFNFAWFPPQIVRFRPDRAPALKPGFEWKPERFDWQLHEGWRYRWFLFIGIPAEGFFDGAPCDPAVVYTDGRFTLLENRPCEAGSARDRSSAATTTRSEISGAR